ncbi:D,D-heptose 1,7-bisphosphate phosphatase [Fontibacillus phaseoli]|uniref:D,D-heptose 1,7-bisphosphate phosphatase n=1 Tax=Fontibacillus phaseoli TaxID=1416533 RepID=A0A369B9Z7_9BACL|nr:HAD-IIIA family hydrolase [Fontibacillus phaseoli]RCX17347.1 D,D-heptose 1,7-bisphosphate phosphatase [Fontibacillus phaseoli]
MITADYVKAINQFISDCTWDNYSEIYRQLSNLADRRGTLYLVGSGGSGSTCDHFANDISKSFGTLLLNRYGFALNVVSATESMSALTAYANDNLLENMFTDFLNKRVTQHDLLMVFSASAPHQNVVRAVEYCSGIGMSTVAVTGESSNELIQLCDVALTVPMDAPSMAEDVFLLLCHCWTSQLREQYEQPTVFLDRDGVLNLNRSDYVKSVDELILTQQAGECIAQLNRAGFATVIITNQAGIGSQLFSETELEQIHNKLKREIQLKGGHIGAIYVCPHTPDEACQCRKPEDGLIERAISELSLRRSHSYLIGDHCSDIQAGIKSRLHTVFLTDGRGSREDFPPGTGAHFNASNLQEAVQYIIGHRKTNVN